MANMSPSALLNHVRTTAGPEALRNLAPIVLSIGLAEGVNPDDPDMYYTPSMTVTPMVHPVLEALMTHHGATRRGRATWQIGYGEDTPQGAIGALLDSARDGTIWWKNDLVRRNTARPLTAPQTEPNTNAWTLAAQNPVVGGYFNAGRAGRFVRHNRYRDPEAYPGFNEAKFGIISLNNTQRAMWVSFHTTELLELPEHLTDEIGEVPLNLWKVKHGFRDAVRVYPAQALAIAEWAATQGLPVWDPSETGSLGKFKADAAQTVVAWPRRGRPAQATVSIGANAPEHMLRALGTVPAGRTLRVLNTDSIALAKSLEGLEGASKLVHPAVLDAAALASAKPVEDEALRDYQREAVGRHLATNLGYVNASSPGLGKTIMVLDAMRRRARTIPSYRGLVVAEANVRAQWCEEAKIWFPGATTIQVESRAEAAKLEQTLLEAGPFPVLVVTSYALASDVMEYIDDVDLTEDRDESEAELDDEELAAELDAAVDVVKAEPVKPAKPVVVKTPAAVLELPDGEPEDLLQMLAMILSEDTVESASSDEDEAAPTVGLGQVLLSQSWHDIVADEAVTLRSTSSKQSKALWALRMNSGVAVALTGTPINKGVNDLGSLAAWVRKDRKLFHGASLESSFDLSSDAELADFTAAMGAILFRRDKSEIQDEIPNVSSQVVALEPTAAERALANAARNELKRAYDELVNWLAAVADEHEGSAQYAAAKEQLAAARHAWLGGTTLARMASSDPAAMLTAKGAGAALLASQGLVAAATAQTGTKRAWVVADAMDRIANGERLLIFTEFATVARGLIEDLDASGIRVGEVIGGGGAKRDRHVVAFRNGELDVLVCTSAGERGLNLQTATTIVHYDLPWTPQGIIQRSGRVERIGATADKIKIVFPIMAGTIEERVASVVVARAATMMRALDTARGVDARMSDVGRALGSLASTAKDGEVTKKEAALLQITRELLAA